MAVGMLGVYASENQEPERGEYCHLPGFLLFNFIPCKIPALKMDGTTHIQDGLFTLTDTSRLFLTD